MKATTEDNADKTEFNARIAVLEGQVATLETKVETLLKESAERGSHGDTAEHKEPKGKKHHNPP